MITSEMRKDPDSEGANWDVLYTKIEKVRQARTHRRTRTST